MTPQNDPSVRVVSDAERISWRVYVVIEGGKWDPEIEMRRRNWLCVESERDRRFVSPVPDGWMSWPDEELLLVIATAKPDLRASWPVTKPGIARR